MKKTIVPLLLSCFILTGLSAQKERAVTANLTGFLFKRPIFIEYETMVSDGISLGFRANYLNYSFAETVPYSESSASPNTFSYTSEGSGVGIGFYSRYYFSRARVIDGIYVGIGIDLIFGNFKDTNEVEYGMSSFGGSSEGSEYIGGSIPLGYRFQAGIVLFDLSIAFGYNSSINEWEKDVLDKAEEVSAPGVYFFPALGIGVKF